MMKQICKGHRRERITPKAHHGWQKTLLSFLKNEDPGALVCPNQTHMSWQFCWDLGDVSIFYLYNKLKLISQCINL
jgi:hypothetical protein